MICFFILSTLYRLSSKISSLFPPFCFYFFVNTFEYSSFLFFFSSEQNRHTNFNRIFFVLTYSIPKIFRIQKNQKKKIWSYLIEKFSLTATKRFFFFLICENYLGTSNGQQKMIANVIQNQRKFCSKRFLED